MHTAADVRRSIIDKARTLDIEDRILLIQEIAATIPAERVHPARHRMMEFGQFSGGRMSTDDDFKDAEWQPATRELNGA